MNKHNLLRAALTEALPVLKDNPDQLRLWVEQGGIVARLGPNLAFEWRYQLELAIVDFTLHPNLVILALVQWLRVHQPDLLTPSRTPSFGFEVDVIDARTCDLAIKLDLTEPVQVVPRADGGFDMITNPEPDPLFAETEPLSTPAVPLTEIYWQGERLIPEPPLP